MGNDAIIENLEACVQRSKSISLKATMDADNHYTALVPHQNIAVISSFTLESGITLKNVKVGYMTWGILNKDRNNALVVCHALTGSSDVLDWWRPLMGAGKALDDTRYFIFCANVLGSPYGSSSPLTTDPATGYQYGPTFPDTTVRDDVRIHKLVLDTLGVHSIAAVVGGSMGGMTTLEWPLCTPRGYVKNIIPIATSAYQGAWGISWSETQRQAIYTDSAFKGGYYTPVPEEQPRRGLGAARMIAMLTYRSHGSFESRFSRKPISALNKTSKSGEIPNTALRRDSLSTESNNVDEASSLKFSAQSYLHYQADKFLQRFDANCYIHLTKKMDTHDVTRGRISSTQSHSEGLSNEDELRETFKIAPSNALVVSVETDVLFRPEQQIELARCLPKAKFAALKSADGHDGFLLEFETLNALITEHLKEQFPWVYTGKELLVDDICLRVNGNEKTNSVFGEAGGFELSA